MIHHFWDLQGFAQVRDLCLIPNKKQVRIEFVLLGHSEKLVTSEIGEEDEG